jgi:putative ubiquitin-RnfH superfamily antitoxin RatB of RatAB toxin-antitoxin module
MRVEVVYARPERQSVVALRLAAGATVRDAIAASGLLERHPEIDPASVKAGLFGTPVRLERVLVEGDRVEILRPLAVDPKEARRRRARRR